MIATRQGRAPSTMTSLAGSPESCRTPERLYQDTTAIPLVVLGLDCTLRPVYGRLLLPEATTPSRTSTGCNPGGFKAVIPTLWLCLRICL